MSATCWYSVCQFSPDPVAGECINVGVFVCAGGGVESRFLVDWRRVEAFADGEEIGFLKDFAARAAGWDEAKLTHAIEHWMNCIHLTKPRASLSEPEELLAYVTGRFLREPRTRARPAVLPSERISDRSLSLDTIEHQEGYGTITTGVNVRGP